jgi:hypothetical protein
MSRRWWLLVISSQYKDMTVKNAKCDKATSFFTGPGLLVFFAVISSD